MELTDVERESLCIALHDEHCQPNCGSDISTYSPSKGPLTAAVEQIVAARVAAALNEVQGVYDMQCPPRRSTFADDEFGRGAHCAHSWWSTVLGATLRRHAIPTTAKESQ